MWPWPLTTHMIKGMAVGHSWPWPFGAKVRCMGLPDSDREDFSCRRAVDSSSYFLRYNETPHEQPPHEQPPLLWGHIFRHHYIFLTSHLNVNPWWTATPLTWSEASDFGSSHPWRAATQQLLEVASHGIHGWFGCGLTDIHVNHTSGQPWVHRPKACKGVDHT